jgi:cyclopropane fatty-acyl-phospholipid synthase-like methyltransferase
MAGEDFRAMTDERDNRLPVTLEQLAVSADERRFSAAAARNSAPILKVLKRILPANGVVLEIGCGTGEHAVHFAAAMPSVTWLPSDPDSGSRASTARWIKFAGLSNVLPPLDIDVCAKSWGVEERAPFDAIVSLNMVHIAPWEASLGLFAGASRLLRVGGLLFLYGAFMRDGVHSAPSNAEFDASLKARNLSWGVRDIVDLERVGESSGLSLRETVEMPANNMSLVFWKSDKRTRNR